MQGDNVQAVVSEDEDWWPWAVRQEGNGQHHLLPMLGRP